MGMTVVVKVRDNLESRVGLASRPGSQVAIGKGSCKSASEPQLAFSTC